jgi:hypothetical protein
MSKDSDPSRFVPAKVQNRPDVQLAIPALSSGTRLAVSIPAGRLPPTESRPVSTPGGFRPFR